MPGETSPYGNIVNPGVLAPNHQHLFSIRIDPAIGALGEGNTVVQEDSVPMPFDRANPPANNPWGVGYTVEKTVIEKSGWADAAPFKNRVFKVGRMDLTPFTVLTRTDCQPLEDQPSLSATNQLQAGATALPAYALSPRQCWLR